MKLDKIKEQLAGLDKSASKKTNKEPKKNVYFKPVIGKQTIRVIPNKYDPDGQFQQIKIYYGIANKTIASPSNWGEKDPIADFIKKLKSENDKESWQLAKKLEAKTRIFTTVIDRSDETEVKLWQFGKLTYQDFLNLADDTEVGDFTDVNSGRDIKLITVGPEQTGTDYNKTTISPALSTSKLSNDKNQIKDWLENQPNPLDPFTKYSFDEIKEFLRIHLTPVDEIGEDQEDIVDEMPKAEVKEAIAKVKTNNQIVKSKSQKFDDLFDEEDN